VTGHMPELSQLKKIIGPDRLLILDACQSLGKYPIDVTTIDADILIGTAHKIFGLTGLGMLRIRRSLLRTLTPARGGGWVVTQVSQKDFTYKSWIEGRESGTPHIVGAISLHAAIQYIASIGWVDTLAQHDQNITSYALQQLTAIPWLSIIGSTTPSTRRAGVISFTIDWHTKTSIAQHMADHNIAIRCGGHCTFPLRDALDEAGSCRMSFHLYTNTSDIDTIVNQLQILSKSR
jgi:cysteine desulfurase/selenocysteine lyase